MKWVIPAILLWCIIPYYQEGDMDTLLSLLEESQMRHSHLCSRQVLGVRTALAGLKLLEIDPMIQRREKTLIVISETDGCFVDGLEVTARVSVGHRSLRIEDYGKLAATFVDVPSSRAVRLRPAMGGRELAVSYYPKEERGSFGQLKAYQTIPDDQLLRAELITLNQDIQEIVGSPRQRTYCIRCGEEVINGREISDSGLPTCRACAGHAYYRIGRVHGYAPVL
jgi:formylmethanofuran dehydrogenase subunit E